MSKGVTVGKSVDSFCKPVDGNNRSQKMSDLRRSTLAYVPHLTENTSRPMTKKKPLAAGRAETRAWSPCALFAVDPQAIESVAHDSQLVGKLRDVELHEQDFSSLEELDGQRPDRMSGKDMFRVSGLRHHLSPANRIVFRFGLDRDDGQRPVVAVLNGHMNIVDLSLANALHASAYVALEVIDAKADESGEHVVISEHAEKRLLVNVGEVAVEQSTHYVRRMILDVNDANRLGIFDQ